MPHYTLRNGETIIVDEQTLQKMQGLPWDRRPNRLVAAIYRDRETRKPVQLSLHNLIHGPAPKGMVRVHKDGDPSNFLPSNIELVPNGKHHANHAVTKMSDLERRGNALTRSTKKFKGVSARGNRFVAAIREDGRQRHLGSFLTAEEAARAYDAALEALGYDPVNLPAP